MNKYVITHWMGKNIDEDIHPMIRENSGVNQIWLDSKGGRFKVR